MTLRRAATSRAILVLACVFLAPAVAFLSAGRMTVQGEESALGAPGFIDSTRESGVEAAINEKYAKDPKWWLSGLDLVDLDGDGRLDLFFSSHGGGPAMAMLGDGRGHFAPAPGTCPPTEIHLAYDVNEDGKVDLQMTWRDGGGKWWINESAPGRLAFRDTAVTAGGAGQARQNAIIDINRDGLADWLHEQPGVVFELGDGRGNFKVGGSLPVEKTRFETNIHPVDLNGDRQIDLVVQWGRYENKEGRSRIYLADGPMRFRDATAESGLPAEGLAVKGVGDVNQDGAPDLLVLEHMKPEVYLNDGRGKFAKKPGAISGMESASRPVYASWGLAVTADFDNDGVADVLWNGRNFLWVLRGTGGGNFTYMNKSWGIEDKSAASVDDGLCFGDFDGDGRLDIVGYAGNIDKDRRVKVYRNNLPPRNWLRVRPVGAPGNRGAAGADILVFDPAEGRRLLAREQVMIVGSQSAHSYYAYAQTERHFGLGGREGADVTVVFHPSGKKVERRGVKANITVEIREQEP